MERFGSRSSAWTEWLGRFLRSWPWQALMLAAAAATAIGLVLLFLPNAALDRLVLFTALGFIVSGVADVIGDEVRPQTRITRWIGVAWIVFGAAVLLWSDRPDVIIPISAALFAASGALRGVAALRRRPVASGPAGIALLEVAIAAGLLLWPHTTLAFIALAYGVRTTISGVSLGTVAAAVRRARLGRGPQAAESEHDDA